jgi:rod shape-determining protein MreC
VKAFTSLIFQVFTVGRGITSFFLCCLISLILLNKDIEYKQGVVDLLFSTVLYPAQVVSSKINSLKSIQGENEFLKKENMRLRLENDMLLQARKENLRYRDMLGFIRDHEFPMTMAEVIARSPGRLQTVFVINRGAEDSIKVNMPVLTSKGLVGRISKVFPGHSHVKLLTDPVVKVSVLENSSRTVGILESPDSYRIRVVLPRHAMVQKGDTLVTSGFGGIFPKGILVGRITDFKKGDLEVVKHALVKLFQDLDYVEEVFVIRKEPDWTYKGQ